MRGLLTIPRYTADKKEVHVQYVEPGVVVKANSGAYLWETPPVHPKATYEKVRSEKKIGSTLFKRSDGPTVYQYKQNADETITSTKNFDKETEVIATKFIIPHPKTREPVFHPNTTFVTLFERVASADSSRRELGREIKKIGEGFMFSRDLNNYKDKFKPFKGELFPDDPMKLPNSAQVHQGVLGNCFLLSTVIALLEKDIGIQYIQNMMKQVNDNFVVVRLYNPKTSEPVYLQVEASNYHFEGENKVLHTANWIHALEKAYSGFGFTTMPGDNTQFIQGEGSMYSVYGSGGFPHLAFKILTNEDAAVVKIDRSTMLDLGDRFGLDLINNYNMMKTLHDNEVDKDVKKMLEEKIIGLEDQITSHEFLQNFPSMAAVREFGKYISQKEREDKLPEGVNEYRQIKMTDRTGFIDFVNKLMPDSDLNSKELRDAKLMILKYANETKDDNPIFYRSNYSGKYTKEELKIFNDIKDRIENKNEMIAASSNSNFKAQGLRNGHGYAVLGVVEKNIDAEHQHVKFVRLRNPWGDTGRYYAWDKLNATPDIAKEEKNISDFYVELGDFCSHFSSYTCCPTPTKLKPDIENANQGKEAKIIADADDNKLSDDNSKPKLK